MRGTQEDIQKLQLKYNPTEPDLDLVLCRGDLALYLQNVRARAEDKLILYSILNRL
jgi:hypothetical protein